MVTIMDGTTSIEGDENLIGNHCNKTASSLHHDLEKLQQSHDELLHQVEAEKVANGKLKSELDEVKSDQSKLESTLTVKDNELKESRELIEDLRKQLAEHGEAGVKFDKIKMLAVKLKKDLATAKDELEKSRSSENQAKEQLKILRQEHEKITNSYQQSIRNFQNLQAEYDKLQDEYEQCKAGAKSVNNDLTNSVTELGKAREELADKMLEADNLTAKVNNLMEVVSEFEGKCKELESTVIVLRSELTSERRKVAVGIGLEKNLEEYKNQLDGQSNTINRLEETLRVYKAKEDEYNSLRPEYEALLVQRGQLLEKSSHLSETISSLESRIETLTSSLEEEKIKSCDLISEKNNLETKLISLDEDSSYRVTNLQEKISGLQESLSLMEEELKRKDDEFDAYKVRVTKVLSEKKQSSKELDQVKVLKEKLESIENEREEEKVKLSKMNEEKIHLEGELRSVIKEKEELSKEMKKLDQLTADNLKLKNLARDLQGRLVMERENFEKEGQKLENENNLTIQALRQEISDLKTKIRLMEDELANYQAQEEDKKNRRGNGTDSPGESPSSLCQSCKSLASLTLQESSPIPSTCDFNSHYLDNVNHNHHPSSSSVQANDLSHESIETNSPTAMSRRRERFSSCSSSTQSHVNPLLEILNSKDESEYSSSTNNFNTSSSANHFDTLSVDDYRKQLNDLSSLLKESESNNALLVEQNRVLKEEIRRIQRSIERADIVQNMEYLKNILVKFISYDSGRSQLIPVLKTILKLSKSEEDLFTSFASHSQSSANNHTKTINDHHRHQSNQGYHNNSSPSSTSTSSINHNQANHSRQQSGNWSSFLWQSFS